MIEIHNTLRVVTVVDGGKEVVGHVSITDDEPEDGVRIKVYRGNLSVAEARELAEAIRIQCDELDPPATPPPAKAKKVAK